MHVCMLAAQGLSRSTRDLSSLRGAGFYLTPALNLHCRHVKIPTPILEYAALHC